MSQDQSSDQKHTVPKGEKTSSTTIFDALHESLQDQCLGDHYTQSLKRRAFFKRTATVITGSVATTGLAAAYLNEPDIHTRTSELRHLALVQGVDVTIAPQTKLNLLKEDRISGISLFKGKVRIINTNQSVDRSVKIETANTTVIAKRDIFVSHMNGVTFLLANGEDAHGYDRSGRQFIISTRSVTQVDQNRATLLSSDWNTVTSWCDGILIADNYTVGSLAEEVNTYWNGRILVSPHAASIPVSGVFYLNDPMKIMDQLSGFDKIKVDKRLLAVKLVIITSV